MLEKNRKKQYLFFAIIAILFIFSLVKFFQGTLISTNTISSQDFIDTILPNSSLSLIVEPNDGMSPILYLIGHATSSIDIVMYQFEDAQIEQALVSAKVRGVAVRVLLNEGYYGKPETANQSAYAYFSAHGIAVKWTPAHFALTHQKTIITDDDDAMILTFNFTPQYYATSRDFALNDKNQNDVLAIEKVFNADWQGNEIAPPQGSDLVWSPRSKNEILSLIDSATSSLFIYNEEMADPDIITALESAANRGVNVQIVMTYASDWKSAFAELVSSGVHIRTYASSASLYIHAKMIVVDDTTAFVGSQNFSAASMNDNRELGIMFTDQNIIHSLDGFFQTDWQGARAMKTI